VSLHFLQTFKALKTLHLHAVDIDSISVSALPLENIELSRLRNVTDFSALQSLRSLKSVTLIELPHLTDLSFLKNHQTTLEYLELWNVAPDTDDLSFLENFHSLKSLCLDAKFPNVTDFLFLSSLESLEEIKLLQLQNLKDLSCLEKMNQLKLIVLGSQPHIKKVPSLSHIQTPFTLQLLNSHFKDLSFLENSKLETLEILDTHGDELITSFDFLGTLPLFRCLVLKYDAFITRYSAAFEHVLKSLERLHAQNKNIMIDCDGLLKFSSDGKAIHPRR
jgi:hypothetical protein